MAPITSAERYILHLSDLHFGTETSPTNAFNQLAEDLKGSDLQCHRLDA
ncbi:hypothetical protein [Desulfosarcina cetonica]|nr:hypothetical protein [Desulfosarcina cetonica]